MLGLAAGAAAAATARIASETITVGIRDIGGSFMSRIRVDRGLRASRMVLSAQSALLKLLVTMQTIADLAQFAAN